MPPPFRPADLAVGDRWVLHSGAELLVSSREEDNTCVELGRDVALVVDVSEAREYGIAYLSLHLHDAYYPVGSMPDSNCGAAVWHRNGELSVIPAPISEEPVGVPEFTSDDTMFNVVVGARNLTEWVAFLTAVPVDRHGYLSDWTSKGIELWRGNVDSAGRISIEAVDSNFVRSRDRADRPRVTGVPAKLPATPAPKRKWFR